ncbi:hypothetical protein CTAYLR_010418 [Chrysophaeum taylorii]|uniref:Uncharacterized protein n=1 Tax=Chrysophaeum taylorii TaxID=2483200 RepID=A0AAD7UGD4_9STRA|nr:hypothetical protein CTAYLR_010418 [Chrysophaeum taylorii]
MVDRRRRRNDDWRPGELNVKRQVVVNAATQDLVISQDTNTSMPGHVLWEVAVVVARLLDQGALPFDVAGRSVLELGAGCGVAGMAFALHGASVVFTDLPALVPHLEANVRRNLGPPMEQPCEWAVIPYDWTDTIPNRLRGRHFDLVLATDCVYHAHLVDPLLDALRAVADPTSTLLLVYERRDPDVLARFEAELKRAFKVKRPIPVHRLRHLLGDDLLFRLRGGDTPEDAEWLTILACRRKRADYNKFRAARREDGASSSAREVT